MIESVTARHKDWLVHTHQPDSEVHCSMIMKYKKMVKKLSKSNTRNYTQLGCDNAVTGDVQSEVLLPWDVSLKVRSKVWRQYCVIVVLSQSVE